MPPARAAAPEARPLRTASPGRHRDMPDVAHHDHGARRIVRLEPVADLERARRAEWRGADGRRPGHARPPPRPVWRDAPTPAKQQQDQHRRGCERDEQPCAEANARLPRDSSLDLGPEIARGLDALGQLRCPVEQLAELRLVVVFRHDSSIPRNNRRARNNWAFEVPTAMPVSSAISSCRYPSTSYSTKTSRAPGGRAATARSRSKPRPGFDSRPGRSSAPGSSVANTRCARRRAARRPMKTTFTARRYNQEENALSPRKVANRSHARTNASCVSSSASLASAVSRRHSAYTRPTCSR